MSTAIKINNFLNNFFKMNLEDSDKELFTSIKDEFASNFRTILMTISLKEKSKNSLSLSETIIQYI